MNFVFSVDEIFSASYSVEANNEAEAKEKLNHYLQSYLLNGSGEKKHDIERVEVKFESADVKNLIKCD